MANPDDKLIPFPDALSTDEDGESWLFDARRWSRVAAHRHAVDEVGTDFNQMSSLRRYIRIFTRQEAWDDWGKDYERDWRQMEAKIGWYFGHSDAARLGSGEGYYYDTMRPDGTWERVPQEVIDACEPPDHVPDDWQPRQDSFVAYEYVDRHHPDALPAYLVTF
jgi:hypothetical protein